MQTDSSAMRTCIASLSAVECTATVWMPISRAARMTRSAISPRLATRILLNMSGPYSRITSGAPARGAGMWFMVFIASTMSSVSPSETEAPTEMNAGAPGSPCR